MYRIEQLRRESGLSQRALSAKIGASPKAVNFWESGKADPSAHFVCALADVFEVSADYLLGRENENGIVNVVSEFSHEERQLLQLWKRLSPKQAEQVKIFATFLLAQT